MLFAVSVLCPNRKYYTILLAADSDFKIEGICNIVLYGLTLKKIL